MENKQCFKCGEAKPLSEFYRHPMTSDGYLGKCKECTKKDVAVNYAKRREQYAAYERERFQRPERKKKCLLYQASRRRKQRKKYFARQAVSNAIRDGRLVRQPCDVCGDENAQAHHDDYNRSLDVVWLCRKHHLERHGKQAYVEPELEI